MDLDKLIALPMPEVKRFKMNVFVPSYENALKIAGFEGPTRNLQFAPDFDRYVVNNFMLRLSKTIDALQQAKIANVYPMIIVYMETRRGGTMELPIIGGEAILPSNALPPLRWTTPFDPVRIVDEAKRLHDAHLSDMPINLEFLVSTRDCMRAPLGHKLFGTPFLTKANTKEKCATAYLAMRKRTSRGKFHLSLQQFVDLVSDLDTAFKHPDIWQGKYRSQLRELYDAVTEECFSPHAEIGRAWMIQAASAPGFFSLSE